MKWEKWNKYRNVREKPNFFPSHKPIRRHWSPFTEPSARHQFRLPDHWYGATVSRDVPVYVPAFAGIHCTYPQRDGQAELIWVVGYMPYPSADGHTFEY